MTTTTKKLRLGDCKHGTIVRIGESYYRVYRLQLLNEMTGLLGTMNPFASLRKCSITLGVWIDTAYVSIESWHKEIDEIVDDSDVAVAGDRWR